MSEPLVAYVASAEEQLAFLLSRFGPQETWSVSEQRLATGQDGASVERATVQTPQGATVIEFRDAHPPEIIMNGEGVDERSGLIDRIMERASTFAAENPPHHPGSMARFPVPVEHYHRAVAVPLPILAVDNSGRRGLYTPPRMAVISWDSIEPVGVREVDGFDPDQWPPALLGEWPAPDAARLSPNELEACIARFSACWTRVLDGWFTNRGGHEPARESLSSDIDDALRLRALLDLAEMDKMYELMNPTFARWLESSRFRGREGRSSI